MNDDMQRLHARLDSVLERVQAALNDLNKRQMLTVEYAAKTGERVEKIDATLLAMTRLVQLLNERLDNADKDTEAPPAADAEAVGDLGMVWGQNGFPNRGAMAVGQPDMQGREEVADRRHTGQPVGPSGSPAVNNAPGANLKDLAQLAEAERIINSICYGLGSLVTPEFRARMQRWLEKRKATNTR